MTVLESQKGSASLHPAHRESVLQKGISPLDSDHSASAQGLDLIDGKVAATNSMPTGPQSGMQQKKRLYSGEQFANWGNTASGRNQKFLPLRQKGGSLI